MKDPLRSRPSPFDVLGVPRTATDTDINAALAAALARGGHPQDLLAAKRTLHDPVERAMAAALDYWEEDFTSLDPSPFADPGVLEAGERSETARAWEETFVAGFPDVAAAHALAVLWLWWADHLDQAADVPPGQDAGPAPSAAWERAVGYWCLLTNAEAFWRSGWAGEAEVASRVRERIPTEIRGRLIRARSAAQAAGRDEEANRLENLEVALETEVTAGRTMAAHIRTARGPVAGGPLLLRRLGLLEGVTALVEKQASENPDDAELRALRAVLSPLAPVAALLDAEQPGRALDALGALDPDVRGRPDARHLSCRAHALLARQEMSVGHHDDSFDAWRAAFEAAPSDEVADLRDAFVTAWQQAVNALPPARRDEAIALLERAVAVVDDERLRQVLADRLLARSYDAFVAAQARVTEKGPTPHAVSALRKALGELERAATLGSARAAEQVAGAREVVAVVLANRGVETINRAQTAMAKDGPTEAGLSSLRSGLKDLERAAELGSAHAADQARQARELIDSIPPPAALEAFKRHDYSTAVAVLEKAVKRARLAPPRGLTDFLAEALTARGVESVNRGQQAVVDAGPSLAAMQNLYSGLEDLERAAGLGSTRAKQQAAVARSVIDALGAGTSPVRVPPGPSRPARTPAARKAPRPPRTHKPRRHRDWQQAAAYVVVVLVLVLGLALWVGIGWGLGALSTRYLGEPWWGWGVAIFLFLLTTVLLGRRAARGR